MSCRPAFESANTSLRSTDGTLPPNLLILISVTWDHIGLFEKVASELADVRKNRTASKEWGTSKKRVGGREGKRKEGLFPGVRVSIGRSSYLKPSSPVP